MRVSHIYHTSSLIVLEEDIYASCIYGIGCVGGSGVVDIWIHDVLKNEKELGNQLKINNSLLRELGHLPASHCTWVTLNLEDALRYTSGDESGNPDPAEVDEFTVNCRILAQDNEEGYLIVSNKKIQY